ncbi:MAG: hypothetical protein KIT00_13605 [Rhodospirillales bacterium]|nr:hypothetical protein [Rhodospirillales bacterium]
MSIHNIEVLEPHPCRRGFFRRIYARVNVHNTQGYWVWQQVDEHGKTLTDAAQAFDSPDAALDNAVKSLKGIAVGVSA